MSQRHSPARLSTRPDDRRSTPAGLLGYLAVLAVGLGLLTDPLVVGAGLAAAGLAAAVVFLARTAAVFRPSSHTAGVGTDPDRRAAD